MATGTDIQAAFALRADQHFLQRIPRSIWRFVRHYPLGALGAAFIILLLAMTVLPDLFTNQDPSFQVIRDRHNPPSGAHWFGTDRLGRDMYTRIVFGARTSIVVGFGVVVVSSVLSTILGVVSGYTGGWFDTIFQRLIDIGIALPGLIFIILFITAFQGMPGGVLYPIIISVAILISIRLSRVIRAGVIAVKEEQYVDAAYALGAGNIRIMAQHIFPNVFALVLVSASIEVGGAILIESALSFLGYGIPPPTASWGRMLNEAREELTRSPHIAIFPGLAIFMTVYSFNMLGDAVRDKLDPRLRGSK